MKISVLLSAHNYTELVLDTIESIRTYASNDLVMIVDEAHWNWGETINVAKIKGLYHNYNKAPYRNLTLGLKTIYENNPNSDWYCYTEYDVLFTSSKFKEDLKIAEENNVWCIGFDSRVQNYQFPYLEKIIEDKLTQSRYLLGCCVFYHKDFLKKLHEMNFFDKFLTLTNGFEEGFFPSFEEQGGYDFGEHLYPTLANYFGKNTAEFSHWNQTLNQWQGNFQRYPVRWRPEITIEEAMNSPSIIHPVKTMELRNFFKAKRYRQWKATNQK